MAMLIEQAGGKALAAPGQRILDVQPSDIHQRTPVILGSADEVDKGSRAAWLIGKKSPAALFADTSFVSGGQRRDFARLLATLVQQAR